MNEMWLFIHKYPYIAKVVKNHFEANSSNNDLLIVVGYGPGYDDIVVHGDLDQPKFVAYYTK